ncbi:MAG: HD-GYP domain-containing protein [Burkholderiales bacterium]
MGMLRQGQEKRRIGVDELAIGSVLPWDAYDSSGRLLLRKGEVISSRNQVEALIERGLFVETPSAHDAVVVTKDSPSALALILEARQRLQLLCALDRPKENFAAQVIGVRHLIGGACSLSAEAALATALMQRHGRYSIRHSVDVAITCAVVGALIEVSEPQLTSIIAAALTMNISMLDLQDTLQAQQEPLTAVQRDTIRRHPQTSAELLRKLGVEDEPWLHAVLCHHEAIDGSGYALARRGEEVPIPSQFILLADVYCARISHRLYRRALRPNAALRALFLDQGKKVQDGLASRFIKAIGVFPPGTPVRLNNGEIGVVTHRGAKAAAPRVSAIIGVGGMPHLVPIKRDTDNPTYAVREVLEWSEVGAPPSMQSLWGKVAARD